MCLLRRRPFFSVAVAAAVSLLIPGVGRSEWQTFNTSSGLVNNFVQAILEDRAGNMWFGTSVGVSRFDGLRWVTYTTQNTDSGLVGDVVSRIVQDRSGAYWFATNGGASRFDGTRWTAYTRENTQGALPSNSVHVVLEHRSGSLWFGTEAGAAHLDGTTWTTYDGANTDGGLPGDRVFSMIEDHAGDVWFGTNAGMADFDGASWRTYTRSNTPGLQSNLGLSILEDTSQNIWVGGLDEINRFDRVSWTDYFQGDNEVPAILQDRSGRIWFALYPGQGDQPGGVVRFDGLQWRSYPPAVGIASQYVQAIAQDHVGNLWFGTRNGVSRYDDVNWTTTTFSFNPEGNDIVGVFHDRSRHLWVQSLVGSISRYDGVSWTADTTLSRMAQEGLLGGSGLPMVLEDRSGDYWIGAAVSRFDGTTWGTFSTPDSLAGKNVHAGFEDPSGRLWFATDHGLVRRDGTGWTSLRTGNTSGGLPSDSTWTLLQDHVGDLWVGTEAGLARFDGQTWTTYTVANTQGGLPNNSVRDVAEDRFGNVWLLTAGGLVTRFDRTDWSTFTSADGVAGDHPTALIADGLGQIWVSTYDGGVCFTDALSEAGKITWHSYSTADGLAQNFVNTLLDDPGGNLWFGTRSGLTRYEPDRVPPRTAYLNRPPPVLATRNASAAFQAAFGETRSIMYSFKFDTPGDAGWSSWSSVGSWSHLNLLDGSHVLEVRSRDYALNIDPQPAVAEFEVDATPPDPRVLSPSAGQAVSGLLSVTGTTADARFLADSVWVRPSGARSWDSPIAVLLGSSDRPLLNGVLAAWPTTSFPDGGYELGLAVTDSLGLTGRAVVSVVVDNQAPSAKETTPAHILAATGGDVFTTNSEMHLYFPPRSLTGDATVEVLPASDDSVPGMLQPSGAIRVWSGYRLSWDGATLEKPARLDVRLGSAVPPAGLAIYVSQDNLRWDRLGGTVDAEARRISLPISAPGGYALFSDPTVDTGDRTLGPLSFTPRVFSPTGGFADREIGIGFNLGRAAPVTVRIYSRSGRLIRDVADNRPLNAGSNLVRWDGRDRKGAFVKDGLYIVTVQALGRTERSTLAVVK